MPKKEIRNGKRVDFSNIYSKIVKYGKTILEVAESYSMSEEEFLERIKLGFQSKLYSEVIKANERNLKRRETLASRGSNSKTQAQIQGEGNVNVVKVEAEKSEPEPEPDVLKILADKKALIEAKISESRHYASLCS